MPKRDDIKTILIIGAGPIIIGQACEFDYSGVQAVKALKDEGYRVVLVNSNPATIMTDPDLADRVYIEPITPDFVAKIIAKEKPDALLPTMGGQTALNCALALEKAGVLKEHGVEMIGARAEVIDKAEDREKFRLAMEKIGLECPKARICRTLDDALAALQDVGLPAIIRPSFTLGGTGGGIAYNIEEFQTIALGGLDASPVNEILVEESVLGWKEYEMEVVRDRADNCIIVCSIENIDPMGVHTGDSITVAPALTLTDKEFQRMRTASIAVLREIGVETGGSNVQFAVNPKDGRMVVIEMNPRVSRSSALASKATGFPIAKIAAKLAVGYTLDELPNDVTGGAIPASFEPTIDYVVTKIPRFAFEKFKDADQRLGTSMKSVGEAMAIGRTFHESLQKALRSLETGLTGLDTPKVPGLGEEDEKNALRAALATPTFDRLLVAAEALRRGLTVADIHQISHFDPWFLERMKEIVEAEAHVAEHGLPEDAAAFRALKAMGFSDARLAALVGERETAVTAKRRALGVRPVYKRIDSCAAEFDAATPYFYGTYAPAAFGGEPESEAAPSDARKAVILGGGPNRIGQGIEFDYCCCHACFACREAGVESIMINCNPETVSTDYDTSDRLYFEPLTTEDVTEILHVEASRGELLGVVVQLGGQTPLKLARDIEAEKFPILGTSPDMIDLAEDRERFQGLLDRLGLKQPRNGIARSKEEALAAAHKVGYPVLLRPSYVLGGRAMEIVHDDGELERYVDTAVIVSGSSPVLVDAYLRDAIEVDVDAVCDEGVVMIAGVMEHIEEAGVHSGDSACSLPPYTLKPDIIARLEEQTRALGAALEVKGLMNVQFAVVGEDVYVLEVNPRASRTAPFVAKATDRPIAKLATRAMLGLDWEWSEGEGDGRVAVKQSVFPFARFPGVDVVLGPEMRSTGEVMGFDTDFDHAFAKSQLGGGAKLPLEGAVFISMKDADKTHVVDIAKAMRDQGFRILATGGTCDALVAAGVPAERINKVLEGRPHVVDALKNKDIHIVFNTTEGARSLADSRSIRRTALENKIPYYTTLAGCRAAVRAIAALKAGGLDALALRA